jgi:hypothetical protein
MLAELIPYNRFLGFLNAYKHGLRKEICCGMECNIFYICFFAMFTRGQAFYLLFPGEAVQGVNAMTSAT